MTNWHEFADKALAGHNLTEEEALSVLNAPDAELLSLLDAAYKVRSKHFGNKVKLNMIINTKTGFCPENCGYCAQSIDAKVPIQKYRMMSEEQILAGAERAHEMNSGTYCIVASGRGPTNRELDTVAGAVKKIKAEYDNMRVCACLGILKPGQAEKLKEAGVDRYNHNLNTSKNHHENITTSHTYDDRVSTVEKVKDAGISPCSGVIVGMKETKQDVYHMGQALRELDADSIPVNFLHAMDGTLLEGTNELTPVYCLKVLCLFRFMNPTKEIRISGGREVNLRSLQPLGLYAANSIFIGDYLTTCGQEGNKDIEMLEDMGFEIDYDNAEDREEALV
ncbi:biotin synthase BioB [Aciduricibacillus chroicocephali]|uniref:Biotin synthase n=1 Tax=Aciduricibacillus chroicocephali TaxID=3054939 RepID=A0ABY9KW39_9BACI|nr:biotin synthase BioB [Bacillaceae bacterium 44XB]